MAEPPFVRTGEVVDPEERRIVAIAATAWTGLIVFAKSIPLYGGLWLQCDGRAVPANTPLYKTGVTNTPDLRGYYLKCPGSGENAGASYPDQTVAVFMDHHHGFQGGSGLRVKGEDDYSMAYPVDPGDANILFAAQTTGVIGEWFYRKDGGLVGSSVEVKRIVLWAYICVGTV